jgi:branched-chain amino acid transport system permease protein
MISLLDTLLQGILLGGLYALFAAGLSLIFGIMRLVNLAHGDLIVLAAFLLFVVSNTLGLNIFVTLVFVAPLMFVIGYGLQSQIFNRMARGDGLSPLLVSFGLSIMLQNGMQQIFSADSRRLQSGDIESASLQLPGGLAVGIMPLLTFAAALTTIIALNQLFYRTNLGRAFRATSDDMDVAQLMGIDNRRIYSIAMGLALVVVAIAALFLGLRANFDPTIGPARLLYAFEAVIIGGLGSLWGTLAGGIIVGLAQTIGARINPEWQILAGHVVFLALLIARPRGLFPRAVD